MMVPIRGIAIMYRGYSPVTLLSISPSSPKSTHAMPVYIYMLPTNNKYYSLSSILQLSDAHELRRIAQLADTKLGTSCVATTERRLEADPWTVELSGGGLVVILLSDIYTIIRDLEEKQGKKKKKLATAAAAACAQWA